MWNSLLSQLRCPLLLAVVALFVIELLRIKNCSCLSTLTPHVAVSWNEFVFLFSSSPHTTFHQTTSNLQCRLQLENGRASFLEGEVFLLVFLSWQDISTSLVTGLGRSLIYQSGPWVVVYWSDCLMFFRDSLRQTDDFSDASAERTIWRVRLSDITLKSCCCRYQTRLSFIEIINKEVPGRCQARACVLNKTSVSKQTLQHAFLKLMSCCFLCQFSHSL